MKGKFTRRQAREWAVQMLVAADLNGPATIEEAIGDFWRQLDSLDEEDGGKGGKAISDDLRAFAEERVRGTFAAREEIDRELDSLLTDWSVERLGTVERAVLRLGMWELKSSDVPKPVVINEAIDLVNWFAGPKSRTLVNGVLDRYAKR